MLLAILTLALLTAGGCSSLNAVFEKSPAGGGSERASEQPERASEQLEQALNLIRNGQDDQAKNILASITAGMSNPGVTDEAFFHLGLITMKEESEAGGFQHSRQIFDQLSRDYRESVWGVHAGHLNELLVGLWQAEVSLGKIKRQLKSLKDTNLSLTRENKELRLNIEKLKSLDLELEQKSRR